MAIAAFVLLCAMRLWKVYGCQLISTGRFKTRRKVIALELSDTRGTRTKESL
jgi:hypothetical protein